MSTIPLTARAPRSYTPPTLEAHYEEKLAAWADAPEDERGEKPIKPVFHIAVPTLVERELIGSLLYELGLIEVRQDRVRTATLEEAIVHLPDGEEQALFLESHWQMQGLHEQQLEIWAERETQRMLDQMEKPDEDLKPIPKPAPLTTLADRIKAKNVTEELYEKSARLRRLMAKRASWDRENQIMMLRVHLRGWEGLETQREGESNPGIADGIDIVTTDAITALREEIGGVVWEELYVSIDGMYQLKQDEVGNYASRPANGPQTNGSKAPTGKASGGSPGRKKAKKSNSAPARARGSRQTTEQSSDSGGAEKA